MKALTRFVPSRVIRINCVARATRSVTTVCVAIVGLVIVSGLMTGCGERPPKLVPVTGKLLHKNEPLTAGSIHLFPDAGNSFDKDQPSSLLQLDGSFTIKTFPYGDGVPPGRYKVTLAPQLAGRIQRPDYADPAKTPLVIDVPDRGITDLVLKVE